MTIIQTCRKFITRKATLAAVAAFAFICTAATIIQKSNFSGEWTFNESKSDLGQFGGRFTPKKIKVEQKEDGLSIERVSSINGEDRTTTEKLSLDGKESENTVFGNSKRKSTVKWADDGNGLIVSSVTSFDRNGEIMEIKSTDKWKLINDGKSLLIESTSTSSMGSNTMKILYDKAK
jgi:hypothetical protein